MLNFENKFRRRNEFWPNSTNFENFVRSTSFDSPSVQREFSNDLEFHLDPKRSQRFVPTRCPTEDSSNKQKNFEMKNEFEKKQQRQHFRLTGRSIETTEIDRKMDRLLLE